MVHTTPTLLALTGLAATATAFKYTSMDHMKCAAAVTQDTNYPTCTSSSKLDCFCAEPFDPSSVSDAAREVCEGVEIPTEYIPSFICRNDDSDSDSDDGDVYGPDHTHHHAVAYNDDNDGDSDSESDKEPVSPPHRISHPMMRVSAPETDSSDVAKHNPNAQNKRAYAPQVQPTTTGPSPSASAPANHAPVSDASSTPDSTNDSEKNAENENESTRSATRVITEVRTRTSCDCSSSTVAAATGRVQSPSAHLHQSAMPVSSSSASSALHGPASGYVSVPASVPTGVDAQRSGYPSGRKTMSSSFGVPSASPSAMTFDGGASVGVLVPSSVVVVGLTALMAFFM
ncbi:extracellular serine rich protein [Aspergillus thermomutatus]|uniref:Extracellular membrane protein CFEM domain-containing protein n=1 Tax=Aspergillus thermomutatus TaxID=41047 RepID=A0A397HIQ5_ASPTH|nr:uncharacterized protein CDV56_108843 [Aspergillus thermomutatus]RHZ62972.1 hypothetical protein CDV56_108843 [Aspergillus thermomutatus]